MKNILVASNMSGGGKTTFTICLMRALMKKGYKVQGYKCGPDYIDTRFHTEITGIDSRNLDSVLMSEEDMKEAFNKSLGDINVVEGVMGFYDGLGKDLSGSAYSLSEDFNLPVILVLSPKAQLMSFVAELKGLLEFRKNNIIGIVLTNVTERYFTMLKECIESELDIKIIGYFKKIKELNFESRHLGLIQSFEVSDIKNRVDLGAQSLMETLNFKYIEDTVANFKFPYEDKNHKKPLEGKPSKEKLRCAVAFDEAFSFYYRDNFDVLERDFEIIKFSPLHDKALPEKTDFLYIGGGYPEVYKDDLEKNKGMRKSIREALEKGLPCYAECGGLMYLTESIEGSEMVSFLKGESSMTTSLQNFGYCKVRRNSKDKIYEYPGHEFHKSIVNLNEDKITDVYKTSEPNKTWKCGYEKNNTFAQYAHIHFSTSKELYHSFLDKAKIYHKEAK